MLQLGAGMGPLGEASVTFRLDPTPVGTRVTIAEEPRRGVARAFDSVLRPLVSAALWGRNGVSLQQLRDVVLDRSR